MDKLHAEALLGLIAELYMVLSGPEPEPLPEPEILEPRMNGKVKEPAAL